MFCSISKNLLFLISNDLTIVLGDAVYCFLEQQSLFNNKLSMYMYHVHRQSKPRSVDVVLYLGLQTMNLFQSYRSCYALLIHQITTSRGFPAEL